MADQRRFAGQRINGVNYVVIVLNAETFCSCLVVDLLADIQLDKRIDLF